MNSFRIFWILSVIFASACANSYHNQGLRARAMDDQGRSIFDAAGDVVSSVFGSRPQQVVMAPPLMAAPYATPQYYRPAPAPYQVPVPVTYGK